MTHSLQLPGGLGDATGGQSEYIEPLARAGVAAGVDAVFMEVHECPERAPSDGPNALPLERMQPLLNVLRDIHELTERPMQESKAEVSDGAAPLGWTISEGIPAPKSLKGALQSYRYEKNLFGMSFTGAFPALIKCNSSGRSARGLASIEF